MMTRKLNARIAGKLKNNYVKRRAQGGQIAPFLIAVIVILITAIMVAVNLGKIALNKTTTANAADAGALAGASTMANALNSLKDMSTDTFMATTTTQAILGICLLECTDAIVSWIATITANWAWFAYIELKVVPDSLEQAETAAKQLAFSNAGIDETKARQSGETYEDWLKRDSRFSQWMTDENYTSEDTYEWFDSDTKYGQESKSSSQRRNAVTVSVDMPNWTAFPLSMPLFYLAWECVGPWCCGPFECCNCYGAAAIAWGLSVVTGAEDPIKVRVSQVEPENNLGLWTMRYSKQGQDNITSSAEAQAYGGSVLPHGSDYDSRLTRVDDR